MPKIPINYFVSADNLTLTPEFKDDFQNSLNTLRYCQKYKLSKNTETIKTMVMTKQRFNEIEYFAISGDEAEDCQSNC